MRSRIRRGVVCGLALLAAGQALSQDDPGARFKKAQEAARANAASAEGHEWMERNRFATDRLMILLLNRCLPDPPGDLPTAFAVYVRLSQAGRAREVLTELDPSLGKCMTSGARDTPFPEAPRDDYWIEVNMAAPL
ncbi:MAG TPA: hypothetical protein VMT70_02690 [Vicinamibacteria bacterium]|nr:hypothetical protein [Vicinamibacteria bacterium]